MQQISDDYVFKSPDDLIAFARQLINEGQAGIFATVDTEGFPRMRWMGTLALEDFPRLYAITSPHCLKVDQLGSHVQVEWMFADKGQNIILNLGGRAEIFQEIHDMKRVWRMIDDKSEAYFLNAFVKKPGFCVIATTICRIECSIPKQNRRFSLKLGPFDSMSEVQVTSLFSKSDTA